MIESLLRAASQVKQELTRGDWSFEITSLWPSFIERKIRLRNKERVGKSQTKKIRKKKKVQRRKSTSSKAEKGNEVSPPSPQGSIKSCRGRCG
jgi:hypothetical protein